MKRKRTSDVGQWWNIVEIYHDEKNSKMIWFWWREKRTSDVGQWWNIVEIHDFQRNSKMIWFWWREKEHQTLLNDEILLKFIMMREILKWSDFDEEKKNIRRWSMMKYCWNSSCYDRNSKMIWYWWREKEHQTLVNDEILLKFIMLREILKWSDIDEERKNIGRCSMMEYSWNSSSSEKF